MDRVFVFVLLVLCSTVVDAADHDRGSSVFSVNISGSPFGSSMMHFDFSKDGQTAVVLANYVWAFMPVMSVYFATGRNTSAWTLAQVIDLGGAPTYCEPNLDSSLVQLSDDGTALAVMCTTVPLVYQRHPQSALFAFHAVVESNASVAFSDVWAMSGDSNTIVAFTSPQNDLRVYTRNSTADRQYAVAAVVPYTEHCGSLAMVVMSVSISSDGTFATVVCTDFKSLNVQTVSLPLVEWGPILSVGQYSQLSNVALVVSDTLIAVANASSDGRHVNMALFDRDVQFVAASQVPLMPGASTITVSPDATTFAIAALGDWGYGNVSVYYGKGSPPWSWSLLDLFQAAPGCPGNVQLVDTITGGFLVASCQPAGMLQIANLGLQLTCDYIDCHSCATSQSCLWCLDTSSCMHSGLTCDDFIKSPKYCPAPPPPPCSTYWNCTDCLTRGASGRCFFCIDTGSCIDQQTTCGNGVVNPQDCPVRPSTPPYEVECSYGIGQVFDVSQDGLTVVAAAAASPTICMFSMTAPNQWTFTQAVDFTVLPNPCQTTYQWPSASLPSSYFSWLQLSGDGLVLAAACGRTGYNLYVFQRTTVADKFTYATGVYESWEVVNPYAQRWAMSSDSNTLLACPYDWRTPQSQPQVVYVYTRSSTADGYTGTSVQTSVCSNARSTFGISAVVAANGAFAAISCGCAGINYGRDVVLVLTLPNLQWGAPFNAAAQGLALVRGDTEIATFSQTMSNVSVATYSLSGTLLGSVTVPTPADAVAASWSISRGQGLMSIGFSFGVPTGAVYVYRNDPVVNWTRWGTLASPGERCPLSMTTLDSNGGLLFAACPSANVIYAADVPITCSQDTNCIACVSATSNNTAYKCGWCLDSSMCVNAVNTDCPDVVTHEKFCPAD